MQDNEANDTSFETATSVQSALEDETYTIGQLADEFNITTRAIRFYESRGLIRPRREGTNRIYSRRDRGRLILILRGKNLGFTLEDIAEYLALYDVDRTQRAQTELLLGKVETAIADLNRKKTDLARSLSDLKELRAKCVSFLKDAD
ncbi:MAG: MerR family DNA-binding transcriptional regulator [Hyphomicrobiaceae bacterium]|nr:MerR family DNA-binding transcriptional regulator [Hyphomicrobiaceae bacterium]MCC0010140.1 MerR family DNA-binding transcriptional regulator [Hyphomicrobiaceae bacterium]